jgi:hypothetical protein
MIFKKKKTRFVIFGLGRSGSTLLKQLLNSHPEIKCEGELLNVDEKYVTNPWLLRLVYRFPHLFFALRSMLSTKPVYGFTLLFYQYSPPAKLIGKLKRKGWKFIHIYRKNSLDQSLSQLVAQQTKVWHRFNDEEIHIPKLLLSPDELLKRLELVDKNKKTELELFEKIAHFQVVYEDDLKNEADWPETTRKIFQFLGINPAPVSASIKKTYSRPYSEIIENYDELLKYVQSQKQI